jgi:hypothetical protein
VWQVGRAITLKYPDRATSRNDKLKVDAAVQELLDTDQVTNDPVREKLWIGCVMIQKLATAVLSDAVQQGTKNWDLTIASTFSIVLQAALASRSGETTRSAGYTGDEYMKWQDIELTATGDGSAFKMTVKLLYRKGHKWVERVILPIPQDFSANIMVFRRDKSDALTAQLGQLPNDNASVVDPVKLCIAYALRIGAVEEKSWPELLDAVRSRPSKRVLWAKPTSPVFCAITRSNQLDMSRPANVQQNQRFLTHAAGLIGMLNAPVPHDIRRGAARDVYSLKSNGSSGSGDLARVGNLLGHTLVSTASGGTGDYIGLGQLPRPSYGEGDSWSERVAQAPKNTMADLPVNLVTAPYKKRRVLSEDIDTYCDGNQLDKTLPHHRHRAGLALQKQAQEQWTKFQRDLLDGVQQPSLPSLPSRPSLLPQASGSAKTTRPRATANPLPPRASATTASARTPLQDLTNVSRMTSDATALTRKRPSPTGSRTDLEQDGAQDNVDPAFRTFASDMLGVQIGAASMGSAAQGSSSNESLAEGCMSLLVASPAPIGNELAFLTAPRDQFIGYLSTVNLVRTGQSDGRRTLEKDAAGNSRDAPSLFLVRCRKEHGCPRGFSTENERNMHEVNCRPAPARTAPIALNGVESDAIVPPPVPTNTKRTYTKRKADDPFKPGFPKVCPDSATCGVIKPSNTPDTFQQHLKAHHDSDWSRDMPCNAPKCTLPRNHYFISGHFFQRHLTRAHLLTSAQAKPYVDKMYASLQNASLQNASSQNASESDASESDASDSDASDSDACPTLTDASESESSESDASESDA